MITVIAFVVFIIVIYCKMQFLGAILLFLLLVLIFPETTRRLPEIVGEAIEEIRVGKYSVKLRRPEKESSIETKAPSGKSTEAISAFNKGNQLLSSGKYEEAVNKYKKSIQINNNFADAHLNLGAAYLGLWHQTGDQRYLTDSISSSRKALQINPHSYRSLTNLAVAYSKMREKEPDALELYDEADGKLDLRDPITWGKVKLFKADLILTLSSRPKGEEYRSRLPEAEIDVLESLRLFEIARKQPEATMWKREAISLLDLIRKRLQALAYAKALREGQEN